MDLTKYNSRGICLHDRTLQRKLINKNGDIFDGPTTRLIHLIKVVNIKMKIIHFPIKEHRRLAQ